MPGCQVMGTGVPKRPAPSPSRIETSFPWELDTATSSLPSSFRSSTTSERGKDCPPEGVVEKCVGLPKPPSPSALATQAAIKQALDSAQAAVGACVVEGAGSGTWTQIVVVGVSINGDMRWREYMPQKAYEAAGFERRRGAVLERAGGEPISDAYLRFLVQEVKPFVDANYPTLPDQRDTFVMGSSMGGLISLYAISQYPDVFYGAGCVSIHWSAGRDELVDEMAKMLPDPKSHKLYFDYGTVGLDAGYEPFQLRMDRHLRKAGYDEQNSITRKFEGADHNEAAWHARVEIPLEFLLGS